jgi:hypothetical protein
LLGAEDGGGLGYKGERGNFELIKWFCISSMVVTKQLYVMVKFLELYIRIVNFIIYKLYFNKPDFKKNIPLKQSL